MLVVNGFFYQESGSDNAAYFDDKHDRVLHHQARGELGEGVDDRLAKYVGIPEALLFCHKCFFSDLGKESAVLQEEMFEYGTKAERGEEGKCPHDQNDAGEKDGEERCVNREGAG